MKKILFQNVRNLFLLVATLAMVSSCKKDANTTETCSGKPLISKISTTLDRSGTTDGGSLSDWIIIQGSNLCGAKSIMFNDIEVDLSTAYITPTEITVAIPRGIPSVVNNKVTLNTNGGEATFAYKVSIPDLVIKGMYNEYTPAGATMLITGKNFDLYEFNGKDGKVIFGSKEIAIERSTSDSIFFKVPMDAVVNTKLKLKDKRGIVTEIPGQYKDNRGIIYDMERTDYWNSSKLTTQDGPVPAPISGKYAYWKGSYTSWNWDEQFHIVWNPSLADIGVVGSSNDFLIKFEINVMNDWAKDAMKIKILGQDYEWKPFSNLPFKTMGWATITIPLNVYKTGGVPIVITQAQANAHTELRLYMHGGDNIDINMALDNFRIVPKN